MPRPRFTLQWLMVAVVGLLTVGMGTVAWYSVLARSYRAEARNFAAYRANCRRLASEWDDEADRLGRLAKQYREMAGATKNPGFPDAYRVGFTLFQGNETTYRTHAASWWRKARYFGVLSRKYEHAARYPWLPVAADPPEPE